MRFRNKPIEIEASCFNPPLQIPEGVINVYLMADGKYTGQVITIHGQRTNVVSGDWIITEPDGIHHYPCKPDIFISRYTPVE